MGKDIFTFKQFTVHQDRCAMKVGTDGVLLGAWAEGGMRILDVGPGTGLIALMMAQRFTTSRVVGVEIDADACLQAQQNATESPFASRLEIVNTRLQDYRPDIRFDSIVSNPPFFMNSLRNPDRQRSVARHTDTLSYTDLFRSVKTLLADSGVFSAVIPAECVEEFISEGCIAGLFLNRNIGVETVVGRPAKRFLLAFGKQTSVTFEPEIVCLRHKNGVSSDWYSRLTCAFYLDR